MHVSTYHICLYTCLSVYLSICLPVCLSIYLSVCLSICLTPLCVSICLFVYSLSLLFCISVCMCPSIPAISRHGTDTVSEFHAEAPHPTASEGLAKVPTWRIERDSNPRPFGRNSSNIPTSHRVQLQRQRPQ